jgi:hypothetical protein
MRYVKAEPAGMDVHLSSPAPGSVHLGYHKIRESVKKGGPTPISGGRGAAYEIVRKMKGKPLYCPAGILGNNDDA